MNFGVIPETFLERVALWLRLVPVPILDLLFGSLKVRIIMAGVRLGVFEAMRDQPRTARELAGALDLDDAALESLLRALTHARYLERRKDRYGLSSLARRTMVAGAPAELTYYARWNETQWRLLEQLETLVRTGRGVDFHRTLNDRQAWEHYQRAMLEVARFDAATLARLAPIPDGATRLIDLGGAHGLLGAAICRRRPPMRSTVIDLPQAIEHSRALAREAGHSDLVDYRAGDLLNDPLEESDAALLANILHHFNPTQVAALLSRVRAALRPGGTVAIWELEAPRRDSRAGHGDLAALFFRLTSTSGAYHGAQYANWLAAAGFSAVRVLRPRISPGRVLVLARAGGSGRMRIAMTYQRITFVTILTYLWVMMILLGSVVLETFMIYPNVFHNPPQSFEATLEFMAVRSPHDFFLPLGFLSWLTGAGALILGWRAKSARYWILSSLIMIVCQGLFSMAFFWPRNRIMFAEGITMHSVDFLKQTAQEFQTLHYWLRLAINVVGSVLIFTGFLKFYRHSVMSDDSLTQKPSNQGG